MTRTKTKDKSWGNSEEENKVLVRTVFGEMGGDKSEINIKKLEWSMEVTHQNYKESITISRKYFDDKDYDGIKVLLRPFLI